MLQTILVYSFLTLSMVAFGVVARGKTLSIERKIPFLNFGMIALLITFSFVMGVRYNVGTDFLNYLDIYQSREGVERMEWGFSLLTNFLSENGFHYSWFFGIVAFLQVFFLFYAFKDDRRIYPYLSFVLILGAYFIPLVNIMRQGIAVCIFVYAIRYIEQRKIWYYLACCTVAVLFHRSAFLLFPLYVVFYKGDSFFRSVRLQVVLLSIAVAIHYAAYDILSVITRPVELFLGILDYQNYEVQHLFAERNLTTEGSGLGFFTAVCVDFFIVFFSRRLKAYFNSERFNIFYSVYIVGALIRVLFSFSYVLLRPFFYLTFMKLVILSYLFFYLWKNVESRWRPAHLFLFFIFIIASILPFVINGEQNYSKFEFFWNFRGLN